MTSKYSKVWRSGFDLPWITFRKKRNKTVNLVRTLWVLEDLQNTMVAIIGGSCLRKPIFNIVSRACFSSVLDESANEGKKNGGLNTANLVWVEVLLAARHYRKELMLKSEGWGMSKQEWWAQARQNQGNKRCIPVPLCCQRAFLARVLEASPPRITFIYLVFKIKFKFFISITSSDERSGILKKKKELHSQLDRNLDPYTAGQQDNRRTAGLRATLKQSRQYWLYSSRANTYFTSFSQRKAKETYIELR